MIATLCLSNRKGGVGKTTCSILTLHTDVRERGAQSFLAITCLRPIEAR